MKHFTLFAISVLTVWSSYAQTIVAQYDFDDSDQGWTVSTNTNGDWNRGVDIFSAGSTDSYWYTSPTDYNDDAVLIIESPIIDLTGQADMVFSMKIRYNTEAAWDGMQVEYSDDGGAGWNVLGAIGDGINWFNDTDVDAIANQADGWSGDNDAWETAKVSLPAALENNANAQFRVRFESDANVTDEGVAFDEVVILAGYEMEVSGNGQEITNGDSSPTLNDDTHFGNVDLATPATKTYTVSNISGGTLTLTGGTPVTISGTNAADFSVTSQPASGSLNALESTTFVVEFDPSATGLRTATVSIANDDSDEAPYTFDIQGIGVNAVVQHDFDAADFGWTVTTNTNGNWARGTAILNTGADGSYWHTEPGAGYNNNAVLIIESPIIDLTGESDLALYMEVRFDTENAWDGYKVEYSDDGGTSWNDLGAYDLGVSGWYNDSDVDAFADDEDAWTGNNGEWTPAQVALPAALDNNANAQFRVLFQSDAAVTETGVAFDNFTIITDGIPDIYVAGNEIEILNGGSAYSLNDTDFRSVDITQGTRTKVFTVSNIGASTLTFTGGTPVTISGINASDFSVISQPPASLAAFESATFSIEFDPAASGFRYASVSIASDDPDEDPFTFNISGKGDNAIVYQDFDSGDEGWTVTTNTNGNWSRGTGILSTGADGSYWHTTPNGGHNNNAVLIIESGTIDLTGQTSLTLFMDVRFLTEEDYDGFQVEYSDDGGTSWNDLGSVGEGLNWYNDADVDAIANNANGWSGNNFNWEAAEMDLPLVLEDNANVQFRVLFYSDASVTETGVAFDNFVIFADVVPLPVELISFSGESINNQIQLSWMTAMELNNDFFEVLHSGDGRTFNPIGTVKGNGNSDQPISYDFLHSTPMLGNNYYRLRQVDFDGTEEFHSIISVYNDHVRKGMEAKVYPNPSILDAMRMQILTGDDHTPITMQVLNLEGQVLVVEELAANIMMDEKFCKDINLEPGIYITVIRQGDYVVTRRIVVK